jgi:hypothetical protein
VVQRGNAAEADLLVHEPGVARPGLRIDEGALSFVTSFCFTYGYSPYKRECGMNNGKRPSSKPASAFDLRQAAQHLRPGQG